MQRISSEFAGFVRDTGVRAFDLLSDKVKDMPAVLRPILRAWTKLSEEQKNELFEALIALVQGKSAEPAPARKPAARRKAPAKKKSSKA